MGMVPPFDRELRLLSSDHTRVLSRPPGWQPLGRDRVQQFLDQ
jgi:hypothetical protein